MEIEPFANYFLLLLNRNLVGKNILSPLSGKLQINIRSDFAKNFLLLIKTAMKKIKKIYNQESCLKKSIFSKLSNVKIGPFSMWRQQCLIVRAKYNLTASNWQVAHHSVIVKSVRVIQYSKKSGVHDNFTCNEYNTLTNNNNMKIWSYSYIWLILRKKIHFLIKASWQKLFIKLAYKTLQ